MARARYRPLTEALRISALWVCALFLVEGAGYLLQQSAGINPAAWGILPRTVSGLMGIVFSPLLHVSQAHLMANALPLFILLTLLFWDRHYHPVATVCMIWFFSGLGTWLIGRGLEGGRPVVHIGASSLVFGLVTYLLVSGLMMRSWRSAGVALVVLIGFGGIFYGVLPDSGPVSWEGHLCGALAGIWAAWRNHD